MSLISPSEFRRRFDEVIDSADKVIVVYSGVWTFAEKLDVPRRDFARVVIEQLMESVGSHRTLLLPAYTPSYIRTRTYSPVDSLPETGILPQTCLRDFAFFRTPSAIDSFLAIGPQAKYLAGLKSPTTLWGEGSLKSLFQLTHARMVTLGTHWKHTLGFLHRIEEAAEVPYRYFKTFHGEWVEEGSARPWEETMFVRSIDVVPQLNWSAVNEVLRSRGLTRRAFGDIIIESADAADIVAAGVEILKQDPYALVTNAEFVRNWVRHGKSAEIAALRLREPRALDYADRLGAA